MKAGSDESASSGLPVILSTEDVAETAGVGIDVTSSVDVAVTGSVVVSSVIVLVAVSVGGGVAVGLLVLSSAGEAVGSSPCANTETVVVLNKIAALDTMRITISFHGLLANIVPP
jgi:hypothetical protein